MNNELNTNNSNNKKGISNTSKIIILVISLSIIMSVCFLGIVNLSEKYGKEASEETTTTTIKAGDYKTYVVFEYYNGINVTDLNWYNDFYANLSSTKLIAVYNCTSDNCSYRYDTTNLTGYDSAYIDGSSVYIYDGGNIYKYNIGSDIDFKQIQLLKTSISLSNFSEDIKDLIIYYNDEDYLVSESYSSTFTSEITRLGSQYSYDAYDKYVLYYSPLLLKNGYIIIQERTKESGNTYTKVVSTSLYDYKNNKVLNTTTDENITVYKYFFEFGKGNFYTNNIVNIYNASDYELTKYNTSNLVYHINDNYFYYNDGKSYKIYNSDGNLVKSSKEYKNVFILYENYAIVEDTDNYVKLIDVTNDNVLANYEITLSQLKVYSIEGNGEYQMYDWSTDIAYIEVENPDDESIITFTIGLEINANWDYYELSYDTESGSYFYNENKE